jgi:hypothetical protein
MSGEVFMSQIRYELLIPPRGYNYHPQVQVDGEDVLWNIDNNITVRITRSFLESLDAIEGLPEWSHNSWACAVAFYADFQRKGFAAAPAQRDVPNCISEVMNVIRQVVPGVNQCVSMRFGKGTSYRDTVRKDISGHGPFVMLFSGADGAKVEFRSIPERKGRKQKRSGELLHTLKAEPGTALIFPQTYFADTDPDLNFEIVGRPDREMGPPMRLFIFYTC